MARLGAYDTIIVTKLLHGQFDSLHQCILNFGQETDAISALSIAVGRRLELVKSLSMLGLRIKPVKNLFSMMGEGVWVHLALWSILSLAFLSRSTPPSPYSLNPLPHFNSS